MNKTSLKIATALLSVIFVLSVFPNVRVNAFEYSGQCGDKVTWSFDGLTLTIDGEGPMYDYNYYDNVTPFSTNLIYKVVISSGVTSIGDYSFYGCRSLSSITIPDSVTSIGDGAFSGYNSLASITIPDSVTSIGDSAFSGCINLASITIPDSVTSIGKYAFSCCSSLSSVNIPTSVISIGGCAFNGCSSLTNITIPNSVTSIDEYMFWDCYSLTSVTIPESVTSIGKYAFSGCSSLSSVNIPTSVTSIEKKTFNGCSSLTSITIPDSVTSIGESAFDGCSSLASITIPDSVTSIGSYAFDGCSSLTSITIPDGVTSIEENVFSGCSSLASITIPDSVTSIGDDAFYGCIRLASIVIPDNVTSIGNGAFANSGLTSVTIPNKVTSINDKLFMYCHDLQSVAIPTSVTSIGESAFEGCSSLASITIPDGVTSIGTYAFAGCSSLISITIPDGVTSIGQSAFYNCEALTSITIPDSVTSIGHYAFCNCISLTSVTIPDNVTEIGSYAFAGCSSLDGVTIPDSVTTIGSYAFNTCTSLTEITIPKDVASIEKAAFGYCENLETVTLPDNLTSIGDYAFIQCESLKNVTIPENVDSIGEYAFANCSALESVDLPDNLTTIGNYSFAACTKLVNVIIPENVVSIGDGAFNNCYNLESVIIEKELYSKLNTSVFENCTKLDSSKIYFYFDVKFVNEDGKELQSDRQAVVPVYNGTTPVKPTDSQHYTFSGWNDGTATYAPNALPVLTADTVFTAQYTANKYTITFVNYDGTTLLSAEYDYGTKAEDIATPSSTPSRKADDQNTYTFTGWDKEIADVTGDATYTAQYSNSTNKYTVTFKDYNGDVLSSATYDYGTKAEDILVPTASRKADVQYTYTFTGWDKEIADVKGDATYTAQYSSTVNKYTVKFVDEEGNVLQSGEVAYGTAPEYTGTPSKAETDTATYAFAGWTDGTTTYGIADNLPTVTGAVTYKAVFTETLKPIEAETEIVKPAETTPAPITYTIGEVKGDGINSDIVIDVHRSEDDANCISYFRSVANNGVAMKNGEQYTAVTGSTIITIKSDYIKTLPAGEYTITVNFKDGSISTTITIPERSEASVPSTGESISPAIYVGVALILVSCATTGFILTKKRREES